MYFAAFSIYIGPVINDVIARPRKASLFGFIDNNNNTEVGEPLYGELLDQH